MHKQRVWLQCTLAACRLYFTLSGAESVLTYGSAGWYPTWDWSFNINHWQPRSLLSTHLFLKLLQPPSRAADHALLSIVGSALPCAKRDQHGLRRDGRLHGSGLRGEVGGGLPPLAWHVPAARERMRERGREGGRGGGERKWVIEVGR